MPKNIQAGFLLIEDVRSRKLGMYVDPVRNYNGLTRVLLDRRCLCAKASVHRDSPDRYNEGEQMSAWEGRDGRSLLVDDQRSRGPEKMQTKIRSRVNLSTNFWSRLLAFDPSSAKWGRKDEL